MRTPGVRLFDNNFRQIADLTKLVRRASYTNNYVRPDVRDKDFFGFAQNPEELPVKTLRVEFEKHPIADMLAADTSGEVVHAVSTVDGHLEYWSIFRRTSAPHGSRFDLDLRPMDPYDEALMREHLARRFNPVETPAPQPAEPAEGDTPKKSKRKRKS